MRLEVKKYLADIQVACQRLVRFTAGKELEDYVGDEMLQSAVERQFEIIGEALNCALRIDPGMGASISDTRRIIAFRNRLIHGYSDLDMRLVWGVVKKNLPLLCREVDLLLSSSE